MSAACSTAHPTLTFATAICATRIEVTSTPASTTIGIHAIPQISEGRCKRNCARD